MTKEEFVKQLRELCRSSSTLDKLAWAVVVDHDCDSFADLYDVLSEQDRQQMVADLEAVWTSLSSPGMQARLK